MTLDEIEDPDAVRALLFDLGGVVIGVDFRRAFRRWASAAGCDHAALERSFQFDTPYEEHERGRLDAAAYFGGLRQSLAVDLTDDDFLAGWNEIYLGPLPGVLPLLSAVSKRFPLYAFTNSNLSHQEFWSARYADELSIFRSVFVSCDLGLRKPEREAFLAVASRIGVEPGAILFFDDLMENVTGARDAGMQAARIASVRDLETLLRQLEGSTGTVY